MAYRRYSNQEREEYFARIDTHEELLEQKRQRYNRIYHRTPIYIASLTLRILFLLFFSWIFFWQGGSGTVTKEVVLVARAGIYLSGKGIKVTKINFETPTGSYEAHFEWIEMPDLISGDTVNIEHNVFGKPTFFSKKGESKYKLALNWTLYTCIGLLTLISFKFNDGRDSFNYKFLWMIWVANLFAFGHYFLT